MKLSTCSSSGEIKFSPTDGLHHLNAIQRPSIKTSNCTWKSSHKGKRLIICNHLLPGHLDGALVAKKKLGKPCKKLEYVRTLLIDNYDSYTYNIYQQLSVINGIPPIVIKNDSWTRDEIIYYLYEEKAFDNVVISPGPGSPSCPADIGICLELLHECGDIPILGVCLGHQALGYVHGAQVVHAPEPVHGRLSEIEHDGNQLFSEIPSGGDSGFKVVRYHSLVVDAEMLPEDLIPIAWTSSGSAVSFSETQSADVVLDAYGHLRQQVCGDSLSKVINGKSQPLRHSENIQSRKILMAIKHSNRPHYGVQFHPESVATRYGMQIFENFRKITEDYWLKSRSSILRGKSAQSIGGQLFREASHNRLLAYGMVDRSSLSLSSRKTNSFARTAVKFLKLSWRKCEGIATKLGGAENIFCELYGNDKADNTFWLDSASTEKGRARFSFMGGRGGPLWKQLTFRLKENSDDGSEGGSYLSVEDAQGSITTAFLEEGFLDYLNTELQSYHCEEKDFEELPFSFYGGFVGYIGYNLKAECGVTTNYHKSKTPDACFFFADNIVAIDHLNNDVYLMSVHDGNTRETSWMDDIEKKLLSLEASLLVNSKDQIKMPHVMSPGEAGFLCEKSKEEYMEDVEKCLKYIKDGESYELCLTTQMRKEIGDINYLGLYWHLRQKNPAPYAAWLNFSKEKLCICCSSPERFLRLDRHGVLEARPIKGTIARGSTKELDHQNKLQLQYSEKDQAENLMIVDLLRNDLGRVCDPGSVHVPHLMDIESYATVHTMVSTVRGKKQSGISAVDCVQAAFPGGSMTGAPKLRSMELLDSLESCSRDIYSGSIGFFSINQTFDLNIVIRTVVIHEGEASIGAGGAIVALSKPEDEYNEMILKTRAPVNALVEYENSL